MVLVHVECTGESPRTVGLTMGERRSFGGIRELPSGRFQAYYAGPDGGRRTAPHTFESKKAADSWLSEVRADIQRGTWRRPELARQRLDAYASAWLRARVDLKPKTREGYASLLDVHILPTLGLLELRQIDAQTVRGWFAERGENAGRTVRARAYALLRTILNEAVRDGALVANPCTIRGASQTNHPERRPASIPELALIADAMPPRYRMLVLAGAWSGLRFGELIALRRSDVDLERLSFLVERGAVRLSGRWVEGAPKSEAGRRVVHLPAHLRDDLIDHLDRFVGPTPDALVFGTSAGTHLLNGNLRRDFNRARLAAGRPDLHFHDLRHTGATLAAQAGATTRELMNRFGHSTSRASLNYQHATMERDRALADALAAAVAESGNVVPLRPARRGH